MTNLDTPPHNHTRTKNKMNIKKYQQNKKDNNQQFFCHLSKCKMN